MTKPWMIDELAHAGPEHLDPGFVAGFDRKQGYPDPAEDLAALREHGIGRRSTVVDLGAGTAAPVAGFLESARLGQDRQAAAARRWLRLQDLIFDFQPAEAEAVLDAWLEDAAEDPSLGYTRDDFAQHVRTEFSTFRWLLEPMLAAAGFGIVTAGFDGQVYGTYTCVRA